MKLTKQELVEIIKEELEKRHIYSSPEFEFGPGPMVKVAPQEYMGYEDPVTQTSVVNPPIDLSDIQPVAPEQEPMVSADLQALSDLYFPEAGPLDKRFKPIPEKTWLGDEEKEGLEAKLHRKFAQAKEKYDRREEEEARVLRHLTTTQKPSGEMQDVPIGQWIPVYEQLTKQDLSNIIKEELESLVHRTEEDLFVLQLPNTDCRPVLDRQQMFRLVNDIKKAIQ